MKTKTLLFLTCLFLCCKMQAQDTVQIRPMVVAEQGSFLIGGTVATDEQGNTYHGDHGYVFYQIPISPRLYPLVFLHGIHQASKTWESTPDGREGFQNIFLRRGFSTYNMTHPRRGNAGRTPVKTLVEPIFDEHIWYTKWRIGIYPGYFKGVQFPKDKASFEQFMRQMTPNTGPMEFEVETNAIAALFDKLGGAIMVAHSRGVMQTWKTIPKTDNIKAIVAWEGGGFFSFPNDEPRPDIDVEEGIEFIMVSPETFERFTRIPMLLVYGDNIPETKNDILELDIWRIRLRLAKLWTEAVNRRGGNVTLVHLPEIGIYGNTHFPMSDLNNIKMADIMSEWLKQQGLDCF
ncbi:MAG: alpha/beta hydrolase [Bacteroides clarus]|uniref:alpha/beta hydrolase n=1 Tax=Bacteroides clarus TaxID=626929 RepID=UPI00241DC44F|nr:alpha/beta fold hydrolase [Bacteroides clarus]MBD9145632.1 alpha/beta hydrolase [Bacteroides clarus]